MRLTLWPCFARGMKRRQRIRRVETAVQELEDRLLLTNWVGDIPNGTVWPAGEVQRITGDVHIPLGSTLTIQPGAVIKFNNNSDIDFIVDGTLLAQGTAAQPIVFTELRDDTGGDTNGDGSATGPSRSNWGALIIQPGSTGSTLNHFELRYGGWRADAELVVNGGELTFTNGAVRNADYYGVRIKNASPTLTNISYVNSGFAAISMDLNSTPVISGVTMTNNPWNGVWLDSGTLPGNSTWNNPDIVYILPDDVTVPQGKTLTLGAGQIIKTGFRTELFVNGTLLANGSAANPVIFANPPDDTAGGDTNNNGAANNSSNDASGGIVFSATSTGSVLDHVDVRNSGFDFDAAIMVNGASITLKNSVIRNSVHAGIRLNSGTAVVTGNTFQNNAWEAINVDLPSNLTALGNTLSNNSWNGVIVRGGTLAANTTWNNPDIVYGLADDVTVPQGMTLTIGAGQVIKTGFRTELFVNGKLTVNGSADAPVIFADTTDDTAGGDTNNDHANSSAANDVSGGIVFSNTSTGSVLDHVEVRNSGNDANAAIMINGASITLTNSVIRDNVHAGIWMNAGTMMISNTDFQRNAWLAIAADVASNVISGGGNTFSQNPVNGLVMLEGTLPANASWNNPDITYALDGNGNGVTIPVGVTLTIGAGQIIKAGNGRIALTVNGTLKALGTATAPVICTSFDDDSVGGDTLNNGAASGPGPGNWKSWSFNATSTNSVLDHVELRYGADTGGGKGGMLNVTGSALTVSNSVFTRSSHLAIGALAGSTLTLTNNLIVNNVSGAGIQAFATSTLIATNNTIDGNGVGIILDSPTATLTNNLITNNLDSGVWQTGPTTLTMSFNDVYNPTSTNYKGFPSQSGTNGNISVDPKYFNRSGGQYQLKPGSPAEDAGTNAGAPLTDFYGNPRFKDPNLPGRGNGSGYDMGAIEVQEIATSDVDLATATISGPATGQQGQMVTVSWTVTSVGSAPATGSWRDAVYLSPSPVFTADAILLGTVQHNGDLANGQGYNASGSFKLPGVTPGNYYFLVRANSQNEVFEASHLDNNVGASSATVAMTIPALTLGVSTNGTLAATGDGVLYQVTIAAGNDLTVVLTGQAGKTNELYIGYGTAPTRQSFDARGVVPGSANQTATINNTQAGTYYVLVYGATIPTSEQFQLVANTPGFALNNVSPIQGGNAGLVTLTLEGSKFDGSSQPRLIDSANGTILPSNVYYSDSGTISATFDLTGHPAGPADVQVVNTGGATQTLTDGFTIMAGTGGHLTTSISSPSDVRQGRTFQITIEYANTGDQDIFAPVLNITGSNADPLSFTTDFTNATNSLDLIGVNPIGPAGILPPGARGTITVYGAATVAGADSIRLTIASYPNSAIDWDGLAPLIQPENLPDADWDVFITHLSENIGTTWDKFALAISKDATLLPPGMGRNYSLSDVFQLEILKVKEQLHSAVTGHVFLNDTSHPLGNVEIRLGNPATGSTYTVRSLLDGSFIIPYVDVATFDVEFVGYESTTQQLVVGAGGLGNLQLVVTSAATISGRVVNSQGAPVPDVIVAALSDDGTTFVTKTAADGTYVIGSLPARDYQVEAGGDSLVRFVIPDVDVTGGGRTDHVNFVLQDAASLSGQVTGPNGPIAGALVVATAADGGGSSAQTDATGHYTINGLAAGVYTVSASIVGLATGKLGPVNVAAGASQVGPNFSLVKGGGVSGQITLLGSGQPVQDQRLSLRGAAGTFFGQADDDGNFSLVDLPAGSYVLTASSADFMTVQGNVTVVANGTATSNLATSPRGTIQGQVTNSAGGLPLPLVFVQIFDDSVFLKSVLTDAQGHYEFDDLDAGSYRLVLGDVGTPGVAQTNATLSTNQTQTTANLSTTVVGVLSGVAFLSDGTTPAPGVTVSLVSNQQPILFASTDAQGKYVFDVLASGTYDLLASGPGMDFPTISQVAVSGGTQLTGLNFRAGDRSITGTVRDQATNQPIAGTGLSISRIDPNVGTVRVAGLQTGSDGSFAFHGAVLGSYTITVDTASHIVASQAVTVTAGGSTPVTMSLVTGSILQGTVRSALTALTVPDAILQVIDSTTSQVLDALVSDTSGAWGTRVAPGSYRLLVQAPGYSSVLSQLVTVGGAPALFDISLDAATTTVDGTVTGAIGPINGARVTITDAQGLVWAGVSTAADGTYHVTGLPAGAYSVAASVLGYRTTAPIALQLNAGQAIAGVNLAPTPIAITDADAPASPAGARPPWITAYSEEDPKDLEPIDPSKVALLHCETPSQQARDLQNELRSEILYFNEVLERLKEGYVELDGALKQIVDAERTLRYELLNDAVADAQSIAALAVKYKNADPLGYAAGIGKFMEHLSKAVEIFGDFRPPPTLLQDLDLLIDGFGTDAHTLDSLRDGIREFPTFNYGGVGQHYPELTYQKELYMSELRYGAVHATEIRNALIAYRANIRKTIDYADIKDQYIAAAVRIIEIQNRMSRACELSAPPKGGVAYNPTDIDTTTVLIGMIPPPDNGDHTDETVEPIGTVNPTSEIPNRPPDEAPSGTNGGTTAVNSASSFDPNDFTGPAGFGPQRFIQPQLMSYRVDFENDPNFATAAAQIVTTTFTLDADLDPATLQFTGFGFGPNNFVVPQGLFHYQTTIDLRSQGIQLLVPVTLDENPVTGVVTVTFQSLDPATNLPPDGINDGFLPIDNEAGDGQGYFTFTAQLKSNRTTGTQIKGQTGIVFDSNAPVQTPEALNTIDVGGPTSSVTALPDSSPLNFTVNWSGSDDAGGSGIASYDIYLSDNGGDYTVWKSGIVATSAEYAGQNGHTYRFYSVARDNVGHVELAPLTADATTLVQVANSAPVIENQSFNIAENSAANANVGTVAASDPDAGNVLTYTFAGATAVPFTIDPATGLIKVATGAALNFEGVSTYQVTVQVTDNGTPAKSSTAQITIHVTDVNEAPTIAAGQSFNVAGNASVGATIGNVSANDPDSTSPNNTKTFSISSGNSSGAFGISPSGQITVANSTALTTLAGQVATLEITVTDGGSPPLSATQAVTITVANVNTAPVLANPGLAPVFIGKTKTAVTVVPTLTVTDADGSATLATVVISLPVGAAKKNPDVVLLPGQSALGIRTEEIVSGRLQITIALNQGATNAAVQAMLQGMTFKTAGKGLKVASRNFQIQVIDRDGLHSNTVTQTVGVKKK